MPSGRYSSSRRSFGACAFAPGTANPVTIVGMPFCSRAGSEKKRAALEPQNPEPYVMVGVQAWDRSYHFPDIDPAARGKIINDGMEALQTALKIKPDNFDALTYMNLLYREKAKIETDDAKTQEDVATADKYREQALELRKKSLATTPTPEPAKK